MITRGGGMRERLLRRDLAEMMADGDDEGAWAPDLRFGSITTADRESLSRFDGDVLDAPCGVFPTLHDVFAARRS